MTYAAWLHELEAPAVASFSPSVANLIRLREIGAPLLPGFVVMPEAVYAFFLEPKLRRSLERTLSDYNPKKAALLAHAAKVVVKTIAEASGPASFKREIAPYLDHLERQLLLGKDATLELELSLPAYDLHHRVSVKSWPDFVKGFTALLLPLFSAQALHARLESESPIVPSLGCVLVRVAREVSFSGIAQQFDPERMDGSTIYVDVHPHHRPHADAHNPEVHRFDAKSLLPLERRTGTARFKRQINGKHSKTTPMHSPHMLDEVAQLRIARLVRASRQLFPDPHCLVWQYAGEHLAITEVVPVHEGAVVRETRALLPSEPVPIGIGRSLNLGVVTGPAHILTTRDDLAQLKEGEIAVVESLANRDYQGLIGCAAIVSETGMEHGVEAELAIRLGVPAVGSLVSARAQVVNGQLITVDGTSGTVYPGRYLAMKNLSAPGEHPALATQLLLDLEDPLNLPKSLDEMAGIGLLRGEFLLELAGLHPKMILDRGLEAEYHAVLSETLEHVARAIYPRPLTYQLHDIRSDSALAQLHTQRHEPNPKLGKHGARRILSDSSLLELELDVISGLRARGLDSIRILVPGVRAEAEVGAIVRQLQWFWPGEESLPDLWLRIAAPALTIRASGLGAYPIAGVYLDIPAISELIVGIDRGNYEVGHHAQQDEPAVLESITKAVRDYRNEGLGCVLIAEDEWLHPTVTEVGIEAGVQAVVVKVADVQESRQLLGSIEQRILLEHARSVD